jgi:hypothetical protein
MTFAETLARGLHREFTVRPGAAADSGGLN